MHSAESVTKLAPLEQRQAFISTDVVPVHPELLEALLRHRIVPDG